jgi:hypothetical protein
VQRRWEVDFGPQFAESKERCGMAHERLALHVNAFKLDLERDPFMYSEPFGDDARRVLQTTDFAEGVVVTAYAILYEDCTARLMWVEAHALPERAQGE